MTIHTLLAMYEKGTITAPHLAILCLERLDPEDASSVLAVLPTQHSSRVVDYAIMYQSPGPLISIGCNYRLQLSESCRSRKVGNML
jgi:hypothetical protein